MNEDKERAKYVISHQMRKRIVDNATATKELYDLEAVLAQLKRAKYLQYTLPRCLDAKASFLLAVENAEICLKNLITMTTQEREFLMKEVEERKEEHKNEPEKTVSNP